MLDPVSNATLEYVAQQYVEDSALLRNARSGLVRSGDIRLRDLKRHDERLSAHLDGLALAGEMGRRLVSRALENPGKGELFTAAVCALRERRLDELTKLLALAEALPEARAGLYSAFGWVSAQCLRGVAAALLDAKASYHRAIGLVACGMHGVDAGLALTTALSETDAALVAVAIRLAGQSGRTDLLPQCLDRLRAEVPGHRFLAARSAVLLGDHGIALDSLQDMALAPGAYQAPAVGLLLKTVPLSRAHEVLTTLARDPSQTRVTLHGIASAGDPRYVDWLLARMQDPTCARLAGHAFNVVTGADLSDRHLDTNPPADDSPASEGALHADSAAAVEDEDESLPWPCPAKTAAWWNENGDTFPPSVRHFMGQAVTRAHCLAVLRSGRQRSRAAAAEYLRLLSPSSSSFNVAAPAWRQERLIEAAI